METKYQGCVTIHHNSAMILPPPIFITLGNIRDCKNNEELQEFLNKRLEKMRSLSIIYITTWGELFCKTYAGLKCMDRALAELGPQMVPERIETPNFLKYFIPCDRKELIQIAWLSGYVLRSLKIRSKASSKKTSS